jgi:hypothetical protein
VSEAHQLSELEYPAILRPLLAKFTEFFPRDVGYNKDTGAISIKASLTQDLQVALAFFRLYGESSDVLDTNPGHRQPVPIVRHHQYARGYIVRNAR